MLEPIELVDLPEQAIAAIHLTIPRAQIQAVMGPGLQELLQTLASQGVTPRGPWLTHHLKMDPAQFDFELAVLVDQPVRSQGRVGPGALPACKAARTVYRGPYEGLGAAWGEFQAQLTARGLALGPSLRERYLVGPEATKDSSRFQTELVKPLR